jgi:hypothetical protein
MRPDHALQAGHQEGRQGQMTQLNEDEMNVTLTLDEPEQNNSRLVAALAAVDALSLALVEHGHTWTDLEHRLVRNAWRAQGKPAS